MNRLTAAIGVGCAVALAVGAIRWSARREAAESGAPGRYVGSVACAGCHAAEFAAWSDSAHAWAMRRVEPGSTVAAFDGRAARLRAGVPTMSLAGPDDTANVRLAFVLGRRSLEQFLTERPDGRLQALPLAFDTQAKEWFDLAGGRPLRRDDWEHWDNRGSTTNGECLYCHTTDFEKGYDGATDSYRSRWSELGVGCEACHGPASDHVRRARAHQIPTGPAELVRAPDMAVCATCHAPRSQVADGFRPGAALLDYFEPTLLDRAAFHPDGQLADEDYEWTSFLQSRMSAEGVRCGDCHEAHGGRLRAEGNALCLGCHAPEYAAVTHTMHDDGPAAACVACHMPERVFMRRDRRRDHRLGLPDPQATVDFGVPNACNACHADRTPEWAARQVAARTHDPTRLLAQRRSTKVFHDARAARPGVATDLLSVLHDDASAVRRASAARLLAAHQASDPAVVPALADAAGDPDPLVRMAAVASLAEQAAPPPSVASVLRRAVHDPVRLVRLKAAWGLRNVVDDVGVQNALAEWEAAHQFRGDTVAGRYNLGVFHESRGNPEGAVAAYRAALRFRPQELWPRQNLAVLLGRTGQRDAAEAEFRELVARHPDEAGGRFAFALLLAEQGRRAETVAMLEETVRRAPGHPRALYNLGLAYAQQMEGRRALETLERAAALPESRDDAIRAIVDLARQMGDGERALRWLERGSELGVFATVRPGRAQAR